MKIFARSERIVGISCASVPRQRARISSVRSRTLRQPVPLACASVSRGRIPKNGVEEHPVWSKNLSAVYQRVPLGCKRARRRRWRLRQLLDAVARQADGCRVRLRARKEADGNESRGRKQKSLRGLAMVVTQHSAESFAAPYWPRTFPNCFRLDDRVVESLVVPLGVLVSHVLPNGAAQGFLTEEDHPVQTLRFERKHVAFGDPGVQIRGARRQPTGSVPASSNKARNAAVNLVSRSIRQNRFSRKKPSIGSVRLRPIWRTQASSGFGVIPAK